MVTQKFGSRELQSAILYIVGYAVLFSASYIMLFNFSEGAQQSGDLLRFTALCGLIATIAGKALLGSITRYPGVETNSYVLPTFSATFGILLLFLILGRMEYSRALLLSSYACAIIWSYIWNILPGRRRTLRIGIVPHGNYPLLQQLDGVTWVLLEHPDQDVTTLNAVALDLRSDPGDIWERRLADYALSGLPVYHSKHLIESMTGRVELETLSENSFGTLSPMSAYMTIKYAIDWVMALFSIFILAPLLVLIAVLIRLDSAGPSIFRQTRIGYRGVPFTVYKFRTMTTKPLAGTDDRSQAMTQTGDKRITRLGAVLRKSRLDELPQLFNVLKGEMSWIGPRPEADVLSRWYETEIAFYRYRHTVRPGITGWAQVNQGHVSEIEDVLSKLHYDFYYIKNYSPWLDILIVVRTVGTMISGFGSK
ncbi:sugar transferase [Sphingomonas dokdonensis]|uniref:UDP-N-acetylgalactosamine-undecaprenyl-phosphate N-acetylgalactosaminephosphotransferase n=1 Tax=Sphingomonas dokdonensis TaxID=344880 RepID=A0A2D0A4K0_9SPHN|nr:sugar transferase [Sphingomonas dokdonensis]OWK27827.1 UDP-N-acetylgalactosamine-undecaprenyl-phosphate N-acetylgalactosaminephosphotransferase [Sphingomonas dokdonensis]